jgi:hypothetical protein
MSSGNVEQIRSDLISLADAVSPKLLPAVVTHIRECISAGELALALEELCAYMGEADRRFDPVQLRSVEQLARSLGVDPSWWSSAKDGPAAG